jgi:hypothetical protein
LLSQPGWGEVARTWQDCVYDTAITELYRDRVIADALQISGKIQIVVERLEGGDRQELESRQNNRRRCPMNSSRGHYLIVVPIERTGKDQHVLVTFSGRLSNQNRLVTA